MLCENVPLVVVTLSFMSSFESVPSVVAALYVNDRCSFVYEVSRRLQGESAFRVVGCVSISCLYKV